MFHNIPIATYYEFEFIDVSRTYVKIKDMMTKCIKQRYLSSRTFCPHSIFCIPSTPSVSLQ